jgi:hypothetical protein
VRRTQPFFIVAAAVLVGACSGPDRGFPSDALGDGAGLADGSADGAPLDASRDATPDRAPIPIDVPDTSLDMTIVYAHSDTTLYAVDPRTNAFSTVGMFAFPTDGHQHAMTDIAVDAAGNVVGVTGDALYAVNEHTAACTLLAALPGMHQFVGLTYLPVGVLDPANEVLVGGATDGTYWRIDATTGNATQLGQFQGGWGLSGDIVSVAGAATYATVRRSTSATDSLAIIDPRTGAVTILGDTRFSRIFGLGYWRSTLFGFTRTGQFIIINATNGSARMISMPAMQFSGAGVTTVAPVAPG